MVCILYCRVSTAEQTLEHQVTLARNASFEIDEVVSDHGISGVSVPLAERPQGKRLFNMLRAGDVLVVRWLDRLGRNYGDVTQSVQKFMQRGVIIKTVINGMVFDGSTKDPMQKAVRDAMLAFMAALGEAQAEATKIAQRAGIEHAKQKGKFLGRKPQYTRAQVDLILEMLAKGTSIIEIARAVGCERQTVYKIRDDTAAAIAALARWDDAGEKPASRPGHGSEGRRKATSRGKELDASINAA